MNPWLAPLVAEEQRKDRLREAEQDRLARQLRAAQARPVPGTLWVQHVRGWLVKLRAQWRRRGTSPEATNQPPPQGGAQVQDIENAMQCPSVSSIKLN